MKIRYTKQGLLADLITFGSTAWAILDQSWSPLLLVPVGLGIGLHGQLKLAGEFNEFIRTEEGKSWIKAKYPDPETARQNAFADWIEEHHGLFRKATTTDTTGPDGSINAEYTVH